MKKLIYLLLALTLLNCSQKNELNEDSGIERILNADSIFTIEDFKNIGFKINKEYDITELDESTGAWFGFWKNNLNKPIDYELRFYNSSMSGSEANSVRAKYLDYFINGNVIILCSGLDLNYATQNCSELSSKIK